MKATKYIIALTIMLMTLTIYGCQGSPDNKPEELLSIDELANLNRPVKAGETSIEETFNVYKKMLARNTKDEGKNILGNAIISENLNILKEQINAGLNNNPLPTLDILEELITINPDPQLAELFFENIRKNSEELFNEQKHKEAYTLITKRFRYGFSTEDMDLKAQIGIELAKKYIDSGDKTGAKSIVDELSSILSIESNSSLQEKYGRQLEELKI